MLRVEGLAIQVGSFALRDVSFSVEDGDYFVILGESGVGKTILLESIAGLQQPHSGIIAWDNEELTRLPIQRRRMGLVYQDQALFPHMTVRKNIAYGSRGVSFSEIASETGVTELLERYPGTLSGGELQRVALARTLAANPRCLLLDEPLSALDQQARAQLRALLRRIHKGGRTIVHVTHDFEEAVSLATRVAIMESGTIVQVGAPDEVFHRPRSEFVGRFIGIRNVLRGCLQGTFADVARFCVNGTSFNVLTDAHPGPGLLFLRSQDITLSRELAETSAQNILRGVITDIFRVPGGTEVVIDAGVELAALVTSESISRLNLSPGVKVYASFKATAARFVGDEP